MHTARAAAAPRYTSIELTLFALLLTIDSLHFVFARALLPYLEPTLSATLVMAVATVEIGLFGWQQGVLDFRTLRSHFWFFVVIGFLVGGSTLLTYASVAYVDIGTASMLGKMATLFSIFLGVVWLRERLTPIQVAGSALAILGVFTITFQPGDYLRLGSLLILISTLMYALHAAIVKRYGDNMEFVTFFFFRVLFTTLFMGAYVVAAGDLLIPPPTVWLLLLVAGTVDVVISRALYYLALRRLSISLHAIVLTLSPAATVMWSFLLFNTLPNMQQLVGGVAVLCGVLLASLGSRR
jgi:drug/metabolite transporter (DMT)-like permease